MGRQVRRTIIWLFEILKVDLQVCRIKMWEVEELRQLTLGGPAFGLSTLVRMLD
jgi:hypothetical protein